MIIRVKLFAAARQLVGQEEIFVELAEPATIADLRAAMGEQYPALRSLLRHVLFAIDTDYVSEHARVTSQCDVACIPPVSGG